jgi:hypothetical protein
MHKLDERAKRLREGWIMEPESSHTLGRRVEPGIALALCAAVLGAGVLEELVRNRPAHAGNFAPDWIPLAAAGLAAAGIMPIIDRPQWGGRCTRPVSC